jgi:hypothetical protein
MFDALPDASIARASGATAVLAAAPGATAILWIDATTGIPPSDVAAPVLRFMV